MILDSNVTRHLKNHKAQPSVGSRNNFEKPKNGFSINREDVTSQTNFKSKSTNLDIITTVDNFSKVSSYESDSYVGGAGEDYCGKQVPVFEKSKSQINYANTMVVSPKGLNLQNVTSKKGD